MTILTGTRVSDVAHTSDGFRITTSTGDLAARRIVLATGGRSLPKSGSDGAGFDIARRLAHKIVPTTPALVPLLLDHDEHGVMHGELSGVSHEAELTLWIDNAVDIRLTGSLLWTHFGISGPLALNMSRHLLRAIIDGRRATLAVSFCPGQTFDKVEQWWAARTAERPQASVSTPLSTLVPASVADALLKRVGVQGARRRWPISRATIAGACRTRSSNGRCA